MRVDVAVEVADDEVELGGSDTEPGHRVRIRRHCRGMTGGIDALRETPDLDAAIERSADARDRPARSLERAVEAHPGLADELRRASRSLRDGLVALACASRSLSRRAVVADAALLEPLRDPDDSRANARVDDVPRARGRGRAEHDAARRCAGGSGASSCASRRATSSGIADLPAVGRGARRARRGAAWRPRSRSSIPTVPIAVIGMGKLGGRELNYASDVDVLFVHDGDADAAERAARAGARAR